MNGTEHLTQPQATYGASCAIATSLKLGSYKLTWTGGTSVSFEYSANSGTNSSVYTISGSQDMGTLSNTPNENYTFVYLFTTSEGKDIYGLWIAKGGNIGLAYNQNPATAFQIRIIKSTSGDNTVTAVYSQADTGKKEQYLNTANPATVTDAMKVGSFSSFEKSKNGEFLIFCPSGGYTPSQFYSGADNKYLDYCHNSTNTYTVGNLYTAVGTPS